METLIKSTTAFKIFSTDRQTGKLTHAYLLHFGDRANLRSALKIFAAELFNANGGLLKRIQNESYTDLTIYPQAGKKISVDGVSEIIGDSALRPVEGDKKLYVITDFDTASALVQNKLLKTLEEPPSNVHFLLGAASLAPVLDTVRSRVKTITISPRSKDRGIARLTPRRQKAAAAFWARRRQSSVRAGFNPSAKRLKKSAQLQKFRR